MLHSQGDKTPEMTLMKNQYKGVNSLREVHTGSLTGKTLSRRKERHEKIQAIHRIQEHGMLQYVCVY